MVSRTVELHDHGYVADEVFAMKDYEAKYYSLVRIAASYDTSMIYTVNPSTVILLAEALGKHTKLG